ncbi:UNVERIFIED_CONTAM: LINE-1 reverse transcriptase [Sesamum latifolium]|uniref:LINE-1 reverse transcriptase n=1 Tax=Sesamum latifolium TaxID=2727402 RepID=A0AAW2XT03_9LAMI
MDKPWLQHLGSECVLCRASTLETHYHLFFSCPFALECLREIRATVTFHWPYSSWDTAIRWAAARWRGKHVVNASYKALLASLVYHLWEERNYRIFQQTERTPVVIARVIVSEIRDLIISKHMVDSVPVSIKLRHLPVELWTNEGLSIVASGIGRPLYPDAITRACTRLDFARVCVMLDISLKLPKHIVDMVPQEDGGETACKVDVEYEWLPPKCNTCMSLGHSMKGCPTMKPKQPPVSVKQQRPRLVREPVRGIGRIRCSYLERAGPEPQRSSGDIRGAAEEFQECLWGMGLITLPMQGEWFTWHNCSRDSRSLWKRLDRLLVNDCWLGCWPNTYYVSLNARTSDHSPLVLRGDTPIQSSTATEKRDLSNDVKLAASFLDAAQNLLAQDRQNPIFLHLEFCCKMVLRLATKLEQHMLHQRAKLAWMKGGDQCSRIFFRKVAKRRSSKRVFQITDSTGQVFTTQPEVISEFITYYQSLLGGDRRDRLIDLLYFRQWARHIISEDEALLLVQSVTPGEIKQAVFDIDESKAPGPDGYSSGFFKAAWPIVGEEVTRAIMEFFVTGRLLKQVNSTLILLIPKVNTPTVVAEFWPISCCNVLYKVITKILVQRMRGILDKLISPSQNAFVPGRSIGENILLAQELFNGYNQQHLPPRCALKVDLRKAYDTVEWDFLSAVLALFGFPKQFILWIEECVTMPSFSVCLNGSPHGFFRGARGLRQGDPMSPYLFVLVMEVLTLYSNSLTKMEDSLIIGTVEGHLPLHYLGLLLLASRLSIADCKPILQKIDSRIRGWDGIMLSFAGRVQLIKSVLTALQGCTGVGYAKVSWQQVCRPVTEGGLGIRDLLALNRGLMSRHLWRVITADRSSIWVDWIFHYRLRGNSIWTVSDRSGSWEWRKLVRLRVCLRPFIVYKIGSGTSFSLCHNPWHELGPLILRFPLGPRHSATSATALLSTVIMEGSWNWPPITNIESIEITNSLPIIHGGIDRILWMGPGGSFSSAAAYDVFHPPGPKVDWSSLLVGTFKIPRHRFIL